MDPYGNERIGFSASAEIDSRGLLRRPFTYNAALEAGGVVVGKQIKRGVSSRSRRCGSRSPTVRAAEQSDSPASTPCVCRRGRRAGPVARRPQR